MALGRLGRPASLEQERRMERDPGFETKTRMYGISVEDSFRATHHVRLANGSVEEPHPHEWRVRAFLSRHELDDLGMVADFESVRTALRAVLFPLEHADLNALAGLREENPTAEVVARYVFEGLIERAVPHLRLVEVTEAPGCTASYEPPR